MIDGLLILLLFQFLGELVIHFTGLPLPAPVVGMVLLLLALMFSVVGIWGSSLVGVEWLGVYEGAFWAAMREGVDFQSHVFKGIIKSVVFGLVVTWIAVYQGYETLPTSEGIAASTTRTVVYSSVAVLVLDFFLTLMMFNF